MHRPLPRVLVAAFALVLVALPCAAEDEDKTRAEIRTLFETLQRAANAHDRTAVAALFDADAMVSGLKRDGFLEPIRPEDRPNLEKGLRIGLRLGLARNDFVEPFTSFEIRSLKPGPVPDTQVAYVRSRDEEGIVTRARWYLARVGGAWRFYDFEDLGTSIRMSSLMGLMLADGIEGVDLGWAATARKVKEAQGLMMAGSFDEAYDLLLEIEEAPLPDPLQGVVQMLLASIDIGRGHGEHALGRLARAEELNADMPIVEYLKSILYNDREEYEKGLVHARRYILALDADADVNLELARALHGLGRPGEAVAPVLAGLAESPGAPLLVAQLAIVLPADRDAELVAQFAKLVDLEGDFEMMAETLLEAQEIDALERLTALFARLRPEHPDAWYYQGMVLSERGDVKGAAARFEQALKRLPEGMPPYLAWAYTDAWVTAMIDSGQALEALARAPDRAQAFGLVARHLSEAGDAEGLREAVARAKDVEGVARARTYYTAEVDYLEGRHAAVVERLTPLRATLAASEEPEDGGIDPDQLLWDTEDRLVRCLVRLRKLEPALALAREIRERDADGFYLVLVHVHRGDVEATTTELLAELERGMEPADFFEDADMQAPLAAAPFKPLRDRVLGGG